MDIAKLTQSSERIEKILGKRKRSLYIVANGKQSTFNLRYSPALDLSGNFELAMVSLDTYNSIPNVDSSNNSLSVFNGTAWTTISLPEGSYDIDAISAAINIPQVSITANTATLKSVITITAPYKVDFNVDNSLSSVLGFEKRVYDAGVSNSTFTVDIMKVTNIKVVTNIVSGSYNNDKVDNTVYSFFPNVAPGYKIIETPIPMYLPVSVDRVNELYVGLVDQNNTPINLRGETLTIRFHLREI